ncbi:MAG TPA: hypothetical protein VKB75_09320 [Jatrophihabitans sp.]|nr:hypothetical protein [Jatrophihabitans sp.]
MSTAIQPDRWVYYTNTSGRITASGLRVYHMSASPSGRSVVLEAAHDSGYGELVLASALWRAGAVITAGSAIARYGVMRMWLTMMHRPDGVMS